MNEFNTFKKYLNLLSNKIYPLIIEIADENKINLPNLISDNTSN